ncbi:protein B4-like [Salvelinus fontinalis]|uniref:protein B4-like n=1 Tax=Salvelinus fontinalis TaxID=8038 RepID=UPI002484F456|nr:protein B4-like [Salvelinus fontinalis]
MRVTLDCKSSNAPAVAWRTPLHPPTMVMVNEALKELDSRKGVSSQAIRGFITEKYPSVDLVRLKYMIRKTLKKGFEGVQGRFRVSDPLTVWQKVTENTDPNVEKAPKAAKVGAKKTKDQEAGKLKRLCSSLLGFRHHPIICPIVWDHCY